jgi:tape measure domain-containing protein
MAERIKGLQIDLSLNDMDVSKKLASVKREFRALNTSMKVSNNNFKYGDKSAASYKNRMNELKVAVDGSSKHLSQLKQRHAEVVAQQGAGSKAALDLANQINKETDAFNMYKSQLSSVTNEYRQNFSTLGKLSQSFKSVGSGMQSAGSKMQGVGKKLTSGITKPALMAGGALAGIAITKGFGRLVEIDTAKAKLSALGNSAKDTNTIMDNALESVKGTSFGMGEAATTAANAVAAGIKPGKELTQYLTNTADAAAIAGADMSEMGSIMNKVQTQNKAYNGELQQLSDRGLPVYQWLAKEAHVSAEEVTEMASKGEISSKMLQNAIKHNIGGAAKEMGQKSFTAALANMWAALGRVGASFLDAGGKGGGFFSKLKPLMNNLTDTFDNMGPQAEQWGVALGNAFGKVIDGITSIINWYQDLNGGTQKVFGGLAKWLAIILVTMGPVLTVFGKMASTIGSMFSGMSTLISFLIRHNVASKTAAAGQAIWNGVTATARGIANGYRAAVAALTTSQTIQAIKSKIAAVAMTVWTGVTKAAALATRGLGLAIRFMTGPVGIVITVITALVAAIIYLWKTNSTFRNIVISTWNAIKNAAIAVFGFLKPYIIGIWNVIKTVTIAVWNAIKASAIAIWNGIKFAVQHPIQALSKTLTALWNGMKAAAIKIWTLLKNAVIAIVKAYINQSRNNFNLLKRIVVTIFNAIKTFAIKVWNALKNGVIRIVKAYVNQTRNNFNILKRVVMTIFNAVKSFSIKLWNSIKNRVISIVKALWNGVRNTFNALNKGVHAIFNAVKNFAVKVWNALKNKVISIVKALWNSVKNTFNSLKKGVTNIFNALKNTSIKIWKNVKKSVVDLANGAKNGVVNGFKAMFNKGKEWLEKLVNFIKNAKDGFNKAASDLGKGVANGAISGLNAMIDGINTLSDKIMKKKLIKNKIPKLSTGTEASPGVKTNSQGQLTKSTKAVINDKGLGNAKGPNGHREIIQRRNGKFEQPSGRNKVVRLKRGDAVHNGMQSKALRPHLSTGTLPHLSLGSFAGDLLNKGKKKVKHGYHETLDTSKNLVEDGKKWAGDKAKSFSKAIGDVMSYVKNPMKLVDKTLKHFGVDFSNIKGAMGGTMSWAYNGLKNGMKDLVGKWLEDAQGGDGDAGWLLKHKILQYFGHYTGGLNFNGGRHYGIDFQMPTGTKIKALTDGLVTQAGPVTGGGGNQVTLKEPGGKWFQWYMHMSKVLAHKGDKVKAGDLLGLSGSTGNSTTPHLHIQRMKGYPSNATAVDPMKWLKSLGSTNKSAKKWKSDIQRAAKQMKVNLSNSELNGIIAQIQRESNGNAGVTQGNIGDINNLRGTPAQGLLQYVPSTFKSYAVKGHTNIKSGYDQLLAFFNNKNWRKDLPYGKSGWGPSGGRRFATGGLINSSGWYNLAEEGHPEFVIPTDPSRQSDAMKLLAIASQRIESNKKNKRPNQMRTPSTSNNNDNEMINVMARQLEATQRQVELLTQLVASSQRLEQKPTGFNERDVSKAQGKKAQMMAYNLGGAF